MTLGAACLLWAACSATFGVPILSVVERRSGPNMRGVNAGRIVACVARLLSNRKRCAVVDFPSNLGGWALADYTAEPYSKPAVPPEIELAQPRPALASALDLDLGPELFFEGEAAAWQEFSSRVDGSLVTTFVMLGQYGFRNYFTAGCAS